MKNAAKTATIWLVTILVLTFVVAGMTLWSKGVKADPLVIKCEGEWCLVPKKILVDLDKNAALAETYAAMCKWGQKKSPEVKPMKFNLSSQKKTSYANSTEGVNQAARIYRGEALNTEKTHELEHQSSWTRQREVEGSGPSGAVQGRGKQSAQRSSEARVRLPLLGDRPGSYLPVGEQGLRSQDRGKWFIPRARGQRDPAYRSASFDRVIFVQPSSAAKAVGLFGEIQ